MTRIRAQHHLALLRREELHVAGCWSTFLTLPAPAYMCEASVWWTGPNVKARGNFDIGDSEPSFAVCWVLLELDWDTQTAEAKLKHAFSTQIGRCREHKSGSSSRKQQWDEGGPHLWLSPLRRHDIVVLVGAGKSSDLLGWEPSLQSWNREGSHRNVHRLDCLQSQSSVCGDCITFCADWLGVPSNRSSINRVVGYNTNLSFTADLFHIYWLAS